MTHPLLTAARNFLADESKRKRKRMPDRDEARVLERTVETLTHYDGDPVDFASRGDVAVGIFGYRDTYPAAAATVIADILWSARLKGHDPVAVMREAWEEYYADTERARSA